MCITVMLLPKAALPASPGPPSASALHFQPPGRTLPQRRTTHARPPPRGLPAGSPPAGSSPPRQRSGTLSARPPAGSSPTCLPVVRVHTLIRRATPSLLCCAGSRLRAPPGCAANDPATSARTGADRDAVPREIALAECRRGAGLPERRTAEGWGVTLCLDDSRRKAAWTSSHHGGFSTSQS